MITHHDKVFICAAYRYL